MSEWRPSRPRASMFRRVRRAARGIIPVAVWGLAVAGTVVLGGVLPTGVRFAAIADSARATVASPVDGRLAALLVGLHQEVEAGQVIARLDDAELRLRLTQATYELERLRADLTRRAAGLESEAAAAATEHGLEASVEQRRLITTVETAQLNALATRTELEEARIRAQGAEVEVERLSALFEQEMVGEPDLVRARTERDALRKRIAELEQLYAGERERVAAAQRRLDAFSPGSVDGLPLEPALAPYRWLLKTQEAELERIALAAERLVLAAPIAGLVQSVTALPGEWVSAGRPLVAIVDPRPPRILGYVPDSARPALAAQRPIEVRREDDTPLGTSAVQSISPTTVRVPEQLWRDPRREEWAYEVVLSATGFEAPGERLRLSLSN